MDLLTLGKIDMPVEDFGSALPLLWITGLGVFVLAVDLFLRDRSLKSFLGWITGLGLLFALIFNNILDPPSGNNVLFNGAYQMDLFTYYANLLILVSVLLSVLSSLDFLRRNDLLQGEFFGLLLLGTSGMMLMVGAGDLVIFFVGFEIMSLVAYILVAWTKKDPLSGEGSIKYLVTGAFSSAVMAFGIVLIFGSVGSFSFSEIARTINSGGIDERVFLAGFALMAGGFAFKVSAVPFHMWAPDAYRGAPTPITGFVSTGVKAAAFLGFLRVFVELIQVHLPEWTTLLAVLAVLSVLGGNIAAIAYRNIKSMLAYSSIAHAGYLLIGVVAITSPDLNVQQQAGEAVMFYLLAYTFMNLGAFACVIYAGESDNEREYLSDFQGLVEDHPWLAVSFAVFLISLTGLPPTAGFLGKVKIFEAAIAGGFTWLAIVGVIGTIISIYYYMRVIMIMFMKEPEEEMTFPFSPTLTIVILVSVWGVFYLGISPARIVELTAHSIRALL